ncbi:MAG: NADH-quinone oxidoreductase subunit J [Gemmataceae bacterium]|nr:NADH-quinone oxidoreductase subunit J [Gemmataceae bacterium]
MEAFLFYLIAGVTGLCAIATVVTQNIVRSATWLLFTLAGVSAIFFLLGADVVGATQLMVYVGGTLVLVVFGVMLTAQGPFITMKTSSAEWAVSATVGLILLAVLAMGIFTLGPTRLSRPDVPSPSAADKDNHPRLAQIREGLAKKALAEEKLISETKQTANLNSQPGSAPASAVIGEALLGVPAGPPHIEGVGATARPVRATYLLPFEIVSVHLLVVLIGAAYLARAKRRRGASS